MKADTKSQLGNRYRGERSHGGPLAPFRGHHCHLSRCPQSLAGIVDSMALRLLSDDLRDTPSARDAVLPLPRTLPFWEMLSTEELDPCPPQGSLR